MFTIINENGLVSSMSVYRYESLLSIYTIVKN
jgi:hypothetical protein